VRGVEWPDDRFVVPDAETHAWRQAVWAAVKGPPALHRNVETVPRWLVAAAERVLRDYGGETARIWNDTP
jgi:hypothetical protein